MTIRRLLAILMALGLVQFAACSLPTGPELDVFVNVGDGSINTNEEDNDTNESNNTDEDNDTSDSGNSEDDHSGDGNGGRN